MCGIAARVSPVNTLPSLTHHTRRWCCTPSRKPAVRLSPHPHLLPPHPIPGVGAARLQENPESGLGARRPGLEKRPAVRCRCGSRQA
eukprot:366080-Chlamydomonas_euryale.AAC.10